MIINSVIGLIFYKTIEYIKNVVLICVRIVCDLTKHTGDEWCYSAHLSLFEVRSRHSASLPTALAAGYGAHCFQVCYRCVLTFWLAKLTKIGGAKSNNNNISNSNSSCSSSSSSIWSWHVHAVCDFNPHRSDYISCTMVYCLCQKIIIMFHSVRVWAKVQCLKPPWWTLVHIHNQVLRVLQPRLVIYRRDDLGAVGSVAGDHWNEPCSTQMVVMKRRQQLIDGKGHLLLSSREQEADQERRALLNKTLPLLTVLSLSALS